MFSVPWGTPRFNIALALSIMLLTIVSAVDSVGDYCACASVAEAPFPPSHTINRGKCIFDGSNLHWAAVVLTQGMPTQCVLCTGVQAINRGKYIFGGSDVHWVAVVLTQGMPAQCSLCAGVHTIAVT